MRRALLMLTIAGCVAPWPPIPRPLPSNVEAACKRTEECGVFRVEQRASCVACLEMIDRDMLAQLEKTYGPLPPLDKTDCETVTAVAQRWTNIAECVAGRWYGP